MKIQLTNGWFASVMRGLGVRLLALVILAALLPFGSVMTLPFLLAACASLALTVTAAILFEEPKATKIPFRLALLIVILGCAWIGIQAIHQTPAGWHDPTWAMAQAIFPGISASISLAPGDAALSAIALAFPFSVFLCALLLCDTDARANMLLALLGTFGGLAAVFGIAQFLMAPGVLLVIDKTAYLDSLTGIFVNRNTAATFYGLTFLINLGRLRDHVLNGIRQGSRSGLADQLLLIALILFTFTALIALMMTRSRAGIAASGLAALIYVPYLVADWKKQTARRRQPRWLPSAWGAGALALTLVIFLIFGAQAILRLKTAGLAEDGRACIFPGLLDASRESGLAGSGFGAFRFAFAPFRDPACGVGGIFDRAHNGYIEGYMGLGILFLILLALALAGALYGLLAGWRNRKRSRHVSVLGFSGLLLVTFHAAFDFSLQIPGVAAFFAAFLASVLSISMARMRRADPLPVATMDEATAEPARL